MKKLLILLFCLFLFSAVGGNAATVNLTNDILLVDTPVLDAEAVPKSYADGLVLAGTNALWGIVTNWIDFLYYPRSNPSNWVTEAVTNNLVPDTRTLTVNGIVWTLGTNGSYTIAGTASTNLFAGSGTTGLVTSAGGDAGKFLKADGTWAAAGGGGSDYATNTTHVATRVVCTNLTGAGIQAALNEAGHNGHVIFQSGIFVITNSLYIPGTNMLLEGSGDLATKFDWSSWTQTNTAFFVDEDSTAIKNIYLKANDNGTDYNLLVINGGSGLLEDLVVDTSDYTGIYLLGSGADDWIIRNVWVKNSGNFGIKSAGGVTGLLLINSRVKDSAGNGGVSIDTGPNTLVNCHVTGSTRVGFTVSKTRLIGCTSSGNTRDGFSIGQESQLTGCNAVNNGSGYHDFYITGDYNVLSVNIAAGGSGKAEYGFYVESGADHNVLSDNISKVHDSGGFYVHTNTTQNIVSGNGTSLEVVQDYALYSTNPGIFRVGGGLQLTNGVPVYSIETTLASNNTSLATGKAIADWVMGQGFGSAEATFTNYFAFSGPGTYTGDPRSGSNTLTQILSDFTGIGLASTSWVDNAYYPRNNPSNWVTESVTNGLWDYISGTNWVDLLYYPRSNPSNWVTETVTNGLLNETQSDLLYLRLDAANDPMQSDLDMGTSGIEMGASNIMQNVGVLNGTNGIYWVLGATTNWLLIE